MAGQDDEQMLRNILKLANDLFFYAPTVCLARAWKTGAAYVYRFDQGNPWQGRWQGEASHITDLTVLLQNYNDHLPEEHRAVGRKYAEDLLIFASGRAPWDALKGNEDSFVQHYGSSPRGRRGDIWSFFDRIGADRLLAVFEAFVARG